VEHAWAQAHGDGVPKDEARAIAALDALCTTGSGPACTRLGLVYLAQPTAAARARAKTALSHACDKGESDACSMLKRLP